MCRTADYHLLGVKGGCVRWQRDYLDTDLLIWLMLILSHNHYDKFSCHDHPLIWVWAPYKTIFETKINRAWIRHEMETFSALAVLQRTAVLGPTININFAPLGQTLPHSNFPSPREPSARGIVYQPDLWSWTRRCSIPNWPAVTEWPDTDIARRENQWVSPIGLDYASSMAR